MSISVGSMSAALGLDFSQFQKGMVSATELARSNSTLMSAEMKRTAREGAESFRLIDESLGIHVSRPLTRILTQEFPTFAAGLQTVLGGAVFGAVAAVGVEAFDKIAKKMEEAKKAQEAYLDAVRNTGVVIGNLGAEHAKAMEEITLELAEKQGKPGAKLQLVDFRIDTEALERAKKGIDEIAEAMAKESKAAAEATKWLTEFWVAVDYVGTNFFSSTSAAQDAATKKFEDFKLTLDDVARSAAADPLKGLRDSLQRVNVEMSTTGAEIAKKMAAIQTAATTTILTPGPHGTQIPTHPDAGISPAALASQQQYFEMLKAQENVLRNILAEDEGRRKIAAAPDFTEELRKANEQLQTFYRDINGSLGKLNPPNPFAKIGAEVDEMRTKANAALSDITDQVRKGILPAEVLDRADSGFKKLTADLELYRIQTEAAFQATEFLKDAQGKALPGAALPTGTNVPGLAQAAPVAPTLIPGGTTGAQFDAFSKDETAKLQAAARAFQDIITPQQKYDLTQQELNLLLQKGYIDQTAFTAAMQKANEQLAEASHKLEDLLKKTGDASAGIQAFFIQLKTNATQDGAFAFDFLNKSLDGFENATIKALTGGKGEWKKYFQELDQMALKFALNTTLSGGLLGLKNIFSHGDVASAASMQVTASTGMQAAAAQQLTAANIMASSGLGTNVGGGPGGVTGGFNPLGFVPGLASGGDLTPGMDYIVGEQGPEPLHVDSSGSAFISPHSSLRDSARTIHVHTHNYDLRGADPATVQKLIQALPLIEERAVARAVNASSEVARRTANPQ